MNHICINSSERYAIIWRPGSAHKYFWITPASVLRLLLLLSTNAWRQSGSVGNETFYKDAQS